MTPSYLNKIAWNLRERQQQARQQGALLISMETSLVARGLSWDAHSLMPKQTSQHCPEPRTIVGADPRPGNPMHFGSILSWGQHGGNNQPVSFQSEKKDNFFFFFSQGNGERPSKAEQSNINDLEPNNFARETLKTESNPFI